MGSFCRETTEASVTATALQWIPIPPADPEFFYVPKPIRNPLFQPSPEIKGLLCSRNPCAQKQLIVGTIRAHPFIARSISVFRAALAAIKSGIMLRLHCRLMHNLETSGKRVTPGNFAHYTIQHVKSGRRSVGYNSADVIGFGCSFPSGSISRTSISSRVL
jgi:hypothetical protein